MWHGRQYLSGAHISPATRKKFVEPLVVSKETVFKQTQEDTSQRSHCCVDRTCEFFNPDILANLSKKPLQPSTLAVFGSDGF